MIISATSLRSVGSGSASARWVLRVVVSVAARIDPSTANPTVEPSARCALMMPEASPARSVGPAGIASEVIGLRHHPPPALTKTSPALTTTVLPCSPTIRTANPTICDAMPRRISRREPTAPTSLPAVSETIIRLMLYGKRRNPASVGEKPRTFCMYCVITSNIPYTANKAAKIVMIASEYVRLLKSLRSIIGSAFLRSQKINAASAAPATTNSVRISAESQPAREPSITANAKAPTAVINTSCPGMSNVRGRERFERGRRAAGRGGRCEESDAGKVELAAAVDVRCRPGRHDGDRHPKAVCRDHPLQARLAYLEVRLDGG